MAVAAQSFVVARPPDEQRMLLRNVSWKEYVLLRDLLEHELWKTNIARLVELFAHVRRIDRYGYGSTTFKNEAKERGAEPDECYDDTPQALGEFEREITAR